MDPRFPRGRHQPQRRFDDLIFDIIFVENSHHENERILIEGGTRVPSASLDPPLEQFKILILDSECSNPQSMDKPNKMSLR